MTRFRVVHRTEYEYGRPMADGFTTDAPPPAGLAVADRRVRRAAHRPDARRVRRDASTCSATRSLASPSIARTARSSSSRSSSSTCGPQPVPTRVAAVGGGRRAAPRSATRRARRRARPVPVAHAVHRRRCSTSSDELTGPEFTPGRSVVDARAATCASGSSPTFRFDAGVQRRHHAARRRARRTPRRVPGLRPRRRRRAAVGRSAGSLRQRLHRDVAAARRAEARRRRRVARVVLGVGRRPRAGWTSTRRTTRCRRCATSPSGGGGTTTTSPRCAAW